MMIRIRLTLLVLAGCLAGTGVNGQILKKIGKKVEKAVEDRLEKEAEDQASKTMDQVFGADPGEAGSGGANDPLRGLPETVYDFTPGSQVIFEDDFSQDAVGSMASKWRSNGSGSVSTVEGVPGKWLRLTPENNYRIAGLEELPQNFTIEFDLLTRCESAEGIRYGHFGLTRDNVVTHAWRQAVAAVSFVQHARWTGNAITFKSEVGKKQKINFPMKNYARRTLRVEVQVTNGNWMKVFFDQYKVLDTDMMYPESAKYFYFTAPKPQGQYDQVYLGNVRIAEIAPASDPEPSPDSPPPGDTIRDAVSGQE